MFSDTATKISKLRSVTNEINSAKIACIGVHEPYMVTFQSNLEYNPSSNDINSYKVFNSVPDSGIMKSGEGIFATANADGGNNKIHNSEPTQDDKIPCIMAVGQKLGWFPTMSVYSTLIK